MYGYLGRTDEIIYDIVKNYNEVFINGNDLSTYYFTRFIDYDEYLVVVTPTTKIKNQVLTAFKVEGRRPGALAKKNPAFIKVEKKNSQANNTK